MTLTHSTDRRQSAIRDKTATDVFEALSSDGPTVDTDAVLDGTTPDELIDRAADPPRTRSIDSTLFDAAAFEELILPDRRSDDSFLWVDTVGTDHDDAARETPPQFVTDSNTAERDRPTDPSDVTVSTMHSTHSTHDGVQDDVTDGDDSMAGGDDSMTHAEDPTSAPVDGSVGTESASDGKSTACADQAAFEIEDTHPAGKVPPRSPTAAAGSTRPERETEPGRESTERSDRSTGRGASDRTDRQDSSSSDPDGDEPKSEIRTTVEYYEHRKSTQTSRFDAIKRLLSRVPGVGGRS